MFPKMQHSAYSNGHQPVKSGVLKKIYCPEHGDKYTMKCSYQSCEKPFMCTNPECIDLHFHLDQQLMANKFDTECLVDNFNKVERIMNCQSIEHSAKTLKKFIDDLKGSLKHVYLNLKTFNQTCEQIKGNIDAPLTKDFIEKISLTCQLQGSLKKQLLSIQKKINMVDPIKNRQFYLKEELGVFLSQQISNFNWRDCEQIYSTKDDLVPCEKFHQKLEAKPKLLFVFVGDDKVVGSYFSKPYPTLKEKSLQDTESFLFLSLTDEVTNTLTEFAKFEAHQEAEMHLSVSRQSYVRHGNTPSLPDGLRTFQRNFQNLDYNLPSKSHSRTIYEGAIDGKLRVKYFMVLQIKQKQKNKMDIDLD